MHGLASHIFFIKDEVLVINVFICFKCRLPPARSAHGAAIYKNNLWIFAGYDGNKRYVPIALKNPKI